MPWRYVQCMLADGPWFEEPEYDAKTGKPIEEVTGPTLEFNDNALEMLEMITKIQK